MGGLGKRGFPYLRRMRAVGVLMGECAQRFGRRVFRVTPSLPPFIIG
jgi:hypothetical protein